MKRKEVSEEMKERKRSQRGVIRRDGEIEERM